LHLSGGRLPRVVLVDGDGIGQAVGPRDKIPFMVNTAAETVHTCGTVLVVSEVVFSTPDELHWTPDATRGLDGLVIVRQPEAAAQASPHKTSRGR
jgi:hypothetical protein